MKSSRLRQPNNEEHSSTRPFGRENTRTQTQRPNASSRTQGLRGAQRNSGRAHEQSLGTEQALPSEDASRPSRRSGIHSTRTQEPLRQTAQRMIQVRSESSRNQDGQSQASRSQASRRSVRSNTQNTRSTKRSGIASVGGILASALGFATSVIKSTFQFLTRGKFLRILVGVGIFVLAALYFLYPSARDYYISIRQHDRMEYELKLLQERHDAIEKKVERLNTGDGVEDLAHQEFGWVKEGENAVKVNGVDTDKTKDLNADIPANSIETPSTWYSAVLDPVFGYNPRRTEDHQ